MNIDYVSLEVAQKLQKAGYKSVCDYAWCYYVTQPPEFKAEWSLERATVDDNGHTYEYATQHVPAPSAVQLAEELPPTIHDDISYKTLEIFRTRGEDGMKWIVSYHNYETTQNFTQIGQNLPDALGLMMAYLLEQGLIKQ